MKMRLADPTQTATQGTAAAIAPYLDSRCEVCGHTIGAHFTSPDHCQILGCPCTEYVSSAELRFPLSLGPPQHLRMRPL